MVVQEREKPCEKERVADRLCRIVTPDARPLLQVSLFQRGFLSSTIGPRAFTLTTNASFGKPGIKIVAIGRFGGFLLLFLLQSCRIELSVCGGRGFIAAIWGFGLLRFLTLLLFGKTFE